MINPLIRHGTALRNRLPIELLLPISCAVLMMREASLARRTKSTEDHALGSRSRNSCRKLHNLHDRSESRPAITRGDEASLEKSRENSRITTPSLLFDLIVHYLVNSHTMTMCKPVKVIRVILPKN